MNDELLGITEECINQNIAYWENLLAELMDEHPTKWDQPNSYEPGKTLFVKMLECSEQIERCNQTKRELFW